MAAQVFFARVAFIGLGLIGSSLARRMKRDRLAGSIAGCAKTEATRSISLKLGFIDEAFADPGEAVRGADLVVLCVPVGANAAIAERLSSTLKAGAIVSDVGSVKSAVDRTRLEAIPSYFYDDAILYKKYVETKYNERTLYHALFQEPRHVIPRQFVHDRSWLVALLHILSVEGIEADLHQPRSLLLLCHRLTPTLHR